MGRVNIDSQAPNKIVQEWLAGQNFVIQMPQVKEVRANIETHPAFGEALEEAKAAGVKIILLGCTVGLDSFTIDESTP